MINKIKDIYHVFNNGFEGHLKDFIIFILEQLHKELKKPINKNNSIKNDKLNQYDKNNAFKHFFINFQKECSIISDLFFGITETTNECLNCKNIFNSQGLLNPICYNYQIFNCLIFPLEAIYNIKNIQEKRNIITIYDCFYYNQKNELLTKENKLIYNI